MADQINTRHDDLPLAWGKEQLRRPPPPRTPKPRPRQGKPANFAAEEQALIPLIGARATLITDAGLTFPVTITQTKYAFGRPRFKVTTADGQLSGWLRLERFLLDDNGARFHAAPHIQPTNFSKDQH